MSGFLLRSTLRAVRMSGVAARPLATPLIPVRHKWQKGIPTQEEQATGLEKIEYDALMAGVKDPWNMDVPTLGVATRESPNIVFSMEDQRIMGCVCEEGQTYIMWWNLNAGEPVRCECGRWFQLKKGNPTKLNII